MSHKHHKKHSIFESSKPTTAAAATADFGNDKWYDRLYGNKSSSAWDDDWDTWGGGRWGRYKACHTGNMLIGKVGEGSLWAGGWTRHADPQAGWHIIDLADTYLNTNVNAVGTGFETVMKVVASDTENVLNLPIGDFKTPTFAPEVFLALAHDVRTILMAGGNVLVACTGGHGRTGMVIAILAYLLGITDSPDPVKWIREIYCAEAVETAEQERYVYTTLNLPIPETSKRRVPSYSVGSTTSTATKAVVATGSEVTHGAHDVCTICGKGPLVKAWGDDPERGFCCDCVDVGGNEEMMRIIADSEREDVLPTVDEDACCVYCGQPVGPDGDPTNGLCPDCIRYFAKKGMSI